jgi:hypothetical protein
VGPHKIIFLLSINRPHGQIIMPIPLVKYSSYNNTPFNIPSKKIDLPVISQRNGSASYFTFQNFLSMIYFVKNVEVP